MSEIQAEALEASDYSDLTRYFDLDILSNPDHDKRFEHLRASLLPATRLESLQFYIDTASKHRAPLLVALCCGAAIFFVIIFLLDRLPWQLFVFRSVVRIEKAPLQIVLEQAAAEAIHPLDTSIVNATPPAPAQPNNEPVVSPAPPALTVVETEQTSTQDADESAPIVFGIRTALQELVQEQVKAEDERATRSRNYPRAFDPRLEQKLASEEIATFNRSRVYEGREGVQTSANNYIVIDGTCYYQAPMEVHGFESAGLPPQARKVDCAEFFGDKPLSRDDVMKKKD